MGKYVEEDCSDKLTSFQHFFYNYGRFHGNSVNILIHITCIPILLITGYKLLEMISYDHLKIPYNLGIILWTWALVWLSKDAFSGIFTTIQYATVLFFLHGRDLSCSGYSSMQIVAAFHIGAWIIQFIGHGLFEQRAPALVTNVLLTINAPLFANLEIFYYVFGYRAKDLECAFTYIKKDIKAFQESKKQD